jgi:hypothetical protein
MKGILQVAFIMFVVLIGIVLVSCLGTGNEGYLESSVEYPDQIAPSPVVDYGSNAGSTGTSATLTNTATPEPEDQEDGYSEDNENLESA